MLLRSSSPISSFNGVSRFEECESKNFENAQKCGNEGRQVQRCHSEQFSVSSVRVFLSMVMAHFLLSSASVQAYYVITRLNPTDALPQMVPAGFVQTKQQYMVGMQPASPMSANYMSRESLSSKQMALPQSAIGMPIVQEARKRSAANAKPLPNQEHVCKMIIRNDFQPKFGHEQNGTRIEIQQDEKRQFRATFVECESTKREQCHGIDNILFTSECVTVYEFRPAGIRLEGSTGDFNEGFVKVPIACQCRLRRKLNRILITES
ncbi:hypothetical protein Ddc_11337 [Ditylenchus destructor]|nr:hypothetical protein Ddc_11337 [Ditylenchus destructor]